MSETTAEPPRPRSRISMLVRHARLPALLLRDDGLPVYDFAPFVAASNAERLVEAVRGDLGCEVVVLRSAWGSYDEAARMLAAAVVAVVPDDRWSPPAGVRWVTAAELATIDMPEPELEAAIASLLAEAPDAAPPALRPRWALPGWFDQASAWFTTAMAATSRPLSGPVRQYRSWGISCVLQATTAHGDVYFKAAGGSDLFADEPAVMTALARLFPDLVPAPLAREPERAWMVLPHLGATLRGRHEPELWIDALLAHGRMQVALAGRVDELLAAGLHDRRLKALDAQIDGLLADQDTSQRLGPQLHAALMAAAPALHETCRRLTDFAVPPSVVHGDLHLGNIAARDGRFAVFDWTDAAVAHPFLDLVTYIGEVRAHADGNALAERFVAAYLALWEHKESPARLQEAWRLARIAGALHQVVSYRHILDGLEPALRWEIADGLTGFAEELLRALEARG